MQKQIYSYKSPIKLFARFIVVIDFLYLVSLLIFNYHKYPNDIPNISLIKSNLDELITPLIMIPIAHIIFLFDFCKHWAIISDEGLEIRGINSKSFYGPNKTFNLKWNDIISISTVDYIGNMKHTEMRFIDKRNPTCEPISVNDLSGVIINNWMVNKSSELYKEIILRAKYAAVVHLDVDMQNLQKWGLNQRDAQQLMSKPSMFSFKRKLEPYEKSIIYLIILMPLVCGIIFVIAFGIVVMLLI